MFHMRKEKSLEAETRESLSGVKAMMLILPMCPFQLNIARIRCCEKSSVRAELYTIYGLALFYIAIRKDTDIDSVKICYQCFRKLTGFQLFYVCPRTKNA